MVIVKPQRAAKESPAQYTGDSFSPDGAAYESPAHRAGEWAVR